MHDPLTGLANRARFGTVLAERLDAHRPASVLLIDVDDFKMVNDTMGHAVGDQLLFEVAQRLRQHSAVTDLPARLGGDEFAVLLDVDDAERGRGGRRAHPDLAGRAVPGRRAPAARATPASASRWPGRATAPTRCCATPTSRCTPPRPAARPSWTRFEPRMRNEVVNHARLGSELHNAIIRQRAVPAVPAGLRPHHRPDLRREALVRWRHPARGFVSPGRLHPGRRALRADRAARLLGAARPPASSSPPGGPSTASTPSRRST